MSGILSSKANFGKIKKDSFVRGFADDVTDTVGADKETMLMLVNFCVN